MHGGKRENAGRKAVNESEKKIGFQIYLTPAQKQEIEEYAAGNSFSEKCVSLISKQLEAERVRAQKTVRVIDLFAGLGGIRLGMKKGFEKLGYNVDCVFSSEIKEYAIKAYKNHFGEETIYGDITQIASSDISSRRGFRYLVRRNKNQEMFGPGLGENIYPSLLEMHIATPVTHYQ